MYELGLRGGYSSPLFPPRDLSQFQSGQPCLDRERGLPGSMDSQCVYSTGPWTGAKQPGLVDERRARGGEQEDEGRRRVGGGGQRGRLTLFLCLGGTYWKGTVCTLQSTKLTVFSDRDCQRSNCRYTQKCDNNGYVYVMIM